MDALGYDLAKIIEAAVTAADSVEPAKIRDALANLENVQGATAIISYKGGDGTPTRPVNVHPDRRTTSAPGQRKRRRTRRSCRRRASTSTRRSDSGAIVAPMLTDSGPSTSAMAPSRPCAASISK